MIYCNIELICAQESETEKEPISINGLLVGELDSEPSCYREIERQPPHSDLRAWEKVMGDGEDVLPYLLQNAESNVKDASLISGDKAYEWLTSLPDFKKWWKRLVKPIFSEGGNVAVALVRFHASKGAIAALGTTALNINKWITDQIHKFSDPVTDMFDTAGNPKPGFNGAAGRALQGAQNLTRWAKRLGPLAYVAVITDELIYGFETGDWETSVYRIAAGSLLVFLGGAAVKALAGSALVTAGTTIAASGASAMGWTVVASGITVLGPLAVVAAAAIIIGIGLYFLNEKYNLTGLAADNMKFIVDSVSEGVTAFYSKAKEAIGNLGRAIDEGISKAVDTGKSALESLGTAVDAAVDTISDAANAASESWNRNVTRPANKGIFQFEKNLIWQMSPQLYHLLYR